MKDETTYSVVKQRRQRRLAVRGVDYRLHEWGDATAPLMIYLHGWADTGSTFQFVVDALARDWFIVAPDWRGFGQSRCDAESYWFPDYLADLDRILEHYSPDQPARLIGHSMGANIASLYAGALPTRVSHLVNIEGFGLPDTSPDEAPARYREWMNAEKRGESFSTYENIESLAQKIRKRSPSVTADKAVFIADQWARTGADGRIQLLADARHKLPNPVLYRRAEAESCWSEITAKTLLISGDQGPFAKTIEGLQTLPFPSAERAVIPECGHMLHFEAPEALATQIEAFLAKPL